MHANCKYRINFTLKNINHYCIYHYFLYVLLKVAFRPQPIFFIKETQSRKKLIPVSKMASLLFPATRCTENCCILQQGFLTLEEWVRGPDRWPWSACVPRGGGFILRRAGEAPKGPRSYLRRSWAKWLLAPSLYQLNAQTALLKMSQLASGQERTARGKYSWRAAAAAPLQLPLVSQMLHSTLKQIRYLFTTLMVFDKK